MPRGRPPSAKTLVDRQLGRNVPHPTLPAGDTYIVPNYSAVGNELKEGLATNLGTLGSVLFINSTGNIAEDNANLFWDNTNKRLGIGTASPDSPLHILSSGADKIRIGRGTGLVRFELANNADNLHLYNNNASVNMMSWIGATGNVGIGTVVPEELLNVFGTDISIMSEGDGVTRAGFKIKTNNVLRWDINSPSAQTRLAFIDGSGVEVMSLEQGGAVGIGIATGIDGLLHVHSGSAGTVTARVGGDELVVENSTNAGISILTPDTSTSTIIFGSPTDPLGADLKWNHDNNVFIIGSRKTDATLRLVSGSGVTALEIDGSQNFDFQDGNLTTTGTITGNLIPNAEMDAGAHTIGFTAQSATGDSTTSIDWRLGNKFNFLFGAFNETFTNTNPSNPCNLILKMTQDATGGRTVTDWGGIKFPGGTAPTLSTAANAVDIISIYFDGTNYYGVESLDFS